MGLQLPSELVQALGMIGFDWPAGDEEKLFEMGQAWIAFSSSLQEASTGAEILAAQAWEGSVGSAVAAFQRWWGDPANAPATIGDAANAAMILGAGLVVCAAIVLALKIQMIVQLVIFAIQVAQAIATAVATAGASLAEIPIFRMITEEIVGMLIDQVIGVLLSA